MESTKRIRLDAKEVVTRTEELLELVKNLEKSSRSSDEYISAKLENLETAIAQQSIRYNQLLDDYIQLDLKYSEIVKKLKEICSFATDRQQVQESPASP